MYFHFLANGCPSNVILKGWTMASQLDQHTIIYQEATCDDQHPFIFIMDHNRENPPFHEIINDKWFQHERSSATRELSQFKPIMLYWKAPILRDILVRDRIHNPSSMPKCHQFTSLCTRTYTWKYCPKLYHAKTITRPRTNVKYSKVGYCTYQTNNIIYCPE